MAKKAVTKKVEVTKKKAIRTKRTIVAARVREVINGAEDVKLRMSATVLDKLDGIVKTLITEACVRCRDNGRVTVQGKDF